MIILVIALGLLALSIAPALVAWARGVETGIYRK